jgi:lathosterol oxidase
MWTKSDLNQILWRGIIVLVICALLHWLLWHVFRDRFAAKKLQTGQPMRGDIRRDILWSLVSVFGVALFYHPLSHLLRAASPLFLSYNIFSLYNFIQYICSFCIYFFLVDAANYWFHRLLHVPVFFRRIHYLHHRSTNPTAWNAMSAHPIESGVMLSFPLLVAAVFPVHYSIGIAYYLLKNISAVLRHLGYDFFSSPLARVPVLNYFVMAGFHNWHHVESNTNYAVMFSWWDYWMGTDHRD